MLIKLDYLVSKYQMNITGIIHVGAHIGQEYDIYKKNGVAHVVFIEPCAGPFKILQDRFENKPDVDLFNYACGSEPGMANINVETANQGMSNSLLRPKDHLKHYPTIRFHSFEQVTIKRLDDLPINREMHNMLCMDTQGYESEVLKGAVDTLKHIDYVYTEIANQELYEGNVMVEGIDLLLSDFERVETKWTDAGWGDCLYVRKQV